MYGSLGESGSLVKCLFRCVSIVFNSPVVQFRCSPAFVRVHTGCPVRFRMHASTLDEHFRWQLDPKSCPVRHICQVQNVSGSTICTVVRFTFLVRLAGSPLYGSSPVLIHHPGMNLLIVDFLFCDVWHVASMHSHSV